MWRPPGAVDWEFRLYGGFLFVLVRAGAAGLHARGHMQIRKKSGRATGPRGVEMAVAFTGVDCQNLATILDPCQAIFVNLGPDPLSET